MNRLCGQFRRVMSGLRGNARSAVACAMILSFLLAHFGYPVWEPVVSKGNVPFPCQFSRCGCQSADQCGQSCCCSKKTKVAKVAFKIRGEVATKPSCCSKKQSAPVSEPIEIRWVL